jgi:hypothetical protein
VAEQLAEDKEQTRSAVGQSKNSACVQPSDWQLNPALFFPVPSPRMRSNTSARQPSIIPNPFACMARRCCVDLFKVAAALAAFTAADKPITWASRVARALQIYHSTLGTGPKIVRRDAEVLLPIARCVQSTYPLLAAPQTHCQQLPNAVLCMSMQVVCGQQNVPTNC